MCPEVVLIFHMTSKKLRDTSDVPFLKRLVATLTVKAHIRSQLSLCGDL
jgi:hypothetical protein